MLTFREYVYDMLFPTQPTPCGCGGSTVGGVPEECPHVWLEGGQGMSVAMARFVAEKAAPQFVDAPNTRILIRRFVDAIAKEIMTDKTIKTMCCIERKGELCMREPGHRGKHKARPGVEWEKAK